MTLPSIINKRALYVESREAKAVIIKDVTLEEEMITITCQIDKSISHMRTWAKDKTYIPLESEEEIILRGVKEATTLRNDYAHARQVGWQLLIDENSVVKFAKKDDSWVAEWF